MKTKRYLQQIYELLQRLDAAIIVRDPGSARSAEVFDGLRKTIIRSGKSHRSHVAHLLTLKDSLDREADIALVRNRVNDFLAELGIKYIYDVDYPSAFEVIGGTGDDLELVEPAIVEIDAEGERSIYQWGKARRVPRPMSAEQLHPSERQVDRDVASDQGTSLALSSEVSGHTKSHHANTGRDAELPEKNDTPNDRTETSADSTKSSSTGTEVPSTRTEIQDQDGDPNLGIDVKHESNSDQTQREMDTP